MLKIALMSSIPYWVGTKNGFVVTWLTKTHFHLGVSGKLPAPLLELLLPPPQAASNAGSESAAPPAPMMVSSFLRSIPAGTSDSGRSSTSDANSSSCDSRYFFRSTRHLLWDPVKRERRP